MVAATVEAFIFPAECMKDYWNNYLLYPDDHWIEIGNDKCKRPVVSTVWCSIVVSLIYIILLFHLFVK